jgi:hypothetical protein
MMSRGRPRTQFSARVSHDVVMTLVFVILCSTRAFLVDSFTWKADLDRYTGVANSQECSSCSIEEEHRTAHRLARRKSQALVASWPTFLCQRSVTLGILETTFEPSKRTTSIRFRCFPRFSIFVFGAATQHRAGEWVVPIGPSWLALPHPTRPSDYGVLKFQIETCREEESTNFHLKSQIVGYRPRLAGESPVSSFRKFLYLNTQGIVHAYVTFRFHRAWHQIILAKAEKDRKENLIAR